MTTGLESQPSFAVGAVNEGVVGQEMVASAPAAVIVGAVVSTTVITWLTAPELLPEASTAFHCFVRTYEPGHAPGTVTSLSSTTWAPASQASLAVGAVKAGTV